MHALNHEKKIFYALLGAMLFIHLCLLVSKIQKDFSVSRVSTPTAIKLKLIQETMKELAMSDTKKQIVQSEDSETLAKPKDPAFLSDKDRSFDRQTVARNVDTFKKMAKGDSEVTQKAQKKALPVPKPSEVMKNMKLSDLGMAAQIPKTQASERAPASLSTKGLASGDPMSDGLSATNDYVEEVKLGDFTHLNTVEYKFYGFYHRIRQKLEQFWGQNIQEKAHNLFRAGRRLPANEDLITSLKITMNEKGEIIDVKILGTSGVRELDDAAIESFNQAGPFPNPPKELLVKGKATIEWGFVVKS